MLSLLRYYSTLLRSTFPKELLFYLMLSLLRYYSTLLRSTFPKELLFYLMLSLLRYYATTAYLSQIITFLVNVIFTTLLRYNGLPFPKNYFFI